MLANKKSLYVFKLISVIVSKLIIHNLLLDDRVKILYTISGSIIFSTFNRLTVIFTLTNPHRLGKRIRTKNTYAYSVKVFHCII